MVRIAPSILAADFVNLERELGRIATADLVHVDVMDNHFVPNLTFGPQMVRRLQQISALPLDVHLMLDDADRWAPGYAELGVFSVTFHAEATQNPVALARILRSHGARVGIAVRPGTSVEPYIGQLDEFDQVLVMTVEPGFGGQSFQKEMMAKIEDARSAIADRDVWLQVDGGVDLRTIVSAAAAGADTFVAGSAIFGADEPATQIAALREAAESIAT